jgi:hypothetical protein
MIDRTVTAGPSRSPRGLARAASALVGVAALLIVGVGPAQASTTPQVSVSPSSIAVGETTTVTATGLGGLEQVFFGMDDTSAGVFTENDDVLYQAAVTDGEATATFSATQAGTVTIAVSNGETPIATVPLTITGGTDTGSVSISASPTGIEIGESTTVTATGLGGLETAFFGLDDNAAGTFEPGGGSSAEAPVTDGSATITFTGAQEGTVTVAVGDGENVLGTTTVTVSAAPSPTPTPSPTASPEPAPAAGWHVGVIIAIIIGALLVIGAVIALVVLAQRRKNPTA